MVDSVCKGEYSRMVSIVIISLYSHFAVHPLEPALTYQYFRERVDVKTPRTP